MDSYIDIMGRWVSHYSFFASSLSDMYDKGGDYIKNALDLFDENRVQIDKQWLLARNNFGKSKIIDEAIVRFATSTVVIGILRYNILDNRIPQLIDALNAARRICDRVSESIILNNLGICYKNIGKFHNAIEYYFMSLDISQEQGDALMECLILGNIGTCYRYLKNFDLALQFYKKQMNVAKITENVKSEAFALGGLATCYRHLELLELSIEHYSLQIILNRRLENRRGEAFALGGIGSIYILMGDFYKAIECFEKRLFINDLMNDLHGRGNALCGLCVLYYTMGDLITSLKYCGEHQRAALESGDARSYANACWNMGAIRIRMGEIHYGLNLLKKCVDVEESIGHPDSQIHLQILDEILLLVNKGYAVNSIINPLLPY